MGSVAPYMCTVRHVHNSAAQSIQYTFFSCGYAKDKHQLWGIRSVVQLFDRFTCFLFFFLKVHGNNRSRRETVRRWTRALRRYFMAQEYEKGGVLAACHIFADNASFAVVHHHSFQDSPSQYIYTYICLFRRHPPPHLTDQKQRHEAK